MTEVGPEISPALAGLSVIANSLIEVLPKRTAKALLERTSFAFNGLRDAENVEPFPWHDGEIAEAVRWWNVMEPLLRQTLRDRDSPTR